MSRGPRRSPLPPAAAPGPVPHTYQGCGAASPQLTGRGDAGMARSGARRGSRPGPPPAGGSHGATSPGAESSPGPRNVLRAGGGSVAPGRTLREGAGRGAARRGARRTEPSRQAAKRALDLRGRSGIRRPPRSGVTRHGPGDGESGGGAPTAARKSRRRRARLETQGII